MGKYSMYDPWFTWRKRGGWEKRNTKKEVQGKLIKVIWGSREKGLFVQNFSHPSWIYKWRSVCPRKLTVIIVSYEFKAVIGLYNFSSFGGFPGGSVVKNPPAK